MYVLHNKCTCIPSMHTCMLIGMFACIPNRTSLMERMPVKLHVHPDSNQNNLIVKIKSHPFNMWLVFSLLFLLPSVLCLPRIQSDERNNLCFDAGQGNITALANSMLLNGQEIVTKNEMMAMFNTLQTTISQPLTLLVRVIGSISRSTIPAIWLWQTSTMV